MKKVSRIGLLSLALLLGASAPAQAQSFFQKHKSKIVAGVAAAAAIGLTVALGLHANKTDQAVKKAGMGDSPDYPDAVLVVGFLGPLGMDRTIQLLNTAIDQKIITREDAASIIITDIGKALAIYWGVPHRIYKAKAGFSYGAQAAKKAAKKVLGAVKGIFGTK